MSITKKVGALLLLLTAGSLIGVMAFTAFFLNTTTDGIFLVASHIGTGLLQQIHIQTLSIRGGDETVRERQVDLIRDFARFVDALERGGEETREGNGRPSIALARELLAVRSSDPVNDLDDVRQTAHVLERGLPEPPAELRFAITRVRIIWRNLEPLLLRVAENPADDPETEAAFETVIKRLPAIEQASRAVTNLLTARIVDQRRQVLLTLAVIAGLSILLFVVGLWFTKRYIARPINLLMQASRGMAGGDFSRRVPIVSTDELAELATTFNEMGDEVSRYLERYRELFENANDMIYTADLEGRFLAVNKAAERITGYDREELQGMKLRQMLMPEYRDLHRQMHNRKISGQQSVTIYNVEILSKDTRKVSLEMSTRLIYEKGKPSGIQATCRDVTERKRLEDQLWLAQKMEAVGRLAGGIAHDFGNVLTIISGYCALILGSTEKDNPVRNEVEGIRRASQRATSLIRHLLGFSKGQIFRPRILNVRKSLVEMTEVLRRLIGEDIYVVTHCPDDIGMIRFDPAQLEQIIVNLALNARDAMAGGGELTIRASNTDLAEPRTNGSSAPLPAGQYIRITVQDTGAGIPPEILGRVFEPFFSTKERGTGLGLSSVYGIVQQAGGAVYVESQVEQGTTFTILLPMVPDVPEHVPALIPEPERAGTETILLAEDEPDVRRLVRQMLQSMGYTVLEALDQDEAITISRNIENRIDLLLTDVVMPKMTGIQLAKRIREFRPHLKVLYMSGYAEDGFPRNGMDEAAPNMMQKPFTHEILAAKVREALDRDDVHEVQKVG